MWCSTMITIQYSHSTLHTPPLLLLPLQKAIAEAKVYLENLEIHPVKVTATFKADQFPSQRGDKEWLYTLLAYPGIGILTNSVLGIIDRTDVKLKSFISGDVLEPPSIIVDRIVNKSIYDIQAQVLSLIGNVFGQLDILGKPAGLVNNIGGGLLEFFYEPAAGIMESPAAFARGLAKGTTGLITGVIGGTISSAATIVSGATEGVSAGAALLSGDNEHAERRRNRESQSKGFLSGMCW